MPDVTSHLRDAGFNDTEIAAWATDKRTQLKAAGFDDAEVDDYFGAPKVSGDVPQAMLDRFDAGAAAKKREGGLIQTVPEFAAMIATPEGRSKLWDTVKQYPMNFVKGMLEQGEIPGEVMKGKIDLNTPEGLDQAIGLGTLVAFGRMGKTPLNGQTAGAALSAGEMIARIERRPDGSIVDQPLGRLPDSSEVSAASTAIGNGDTTPLMEKKLVDLYEQKGIHPAEVAHDAQTDPTVSQSILSSDPQDMPAGYGPPPSPPEAAAPAGGKPPEYSDAEKQILSKISIGETSPTEKLSFNKLYTNFVDKLFPLSKAVKEAGAELPSEDNPYQLARLLSGHVGKADHFINNGTFDFETYENNGPSLKQVLRPVAADLNGFRAYATAARALELEGRGIKSGFAEPTAGAPPLVAEGLDAARTVVSEGAAKYEKPFRALVDYQNRVSQYLRDSGVLSDAGYKAMIEANKMYVPFSRVMGLDADAPAVSGSTLQARNPIKAIKGSARDIIDPVESVVRNTYHFIEMAEKNQVGGKLVDMLLRAGEELPEARAAAIAETLATSTDEKAIADALNEVGLKQVNDLAISLYSARTPDRAGQISVLRDGKRTTYQVDHDLARAMKGLDAQSMGLLEKVLSYPASVLRAGAVTTPDFALRHTIRDFLYAATTFKGGQFSPADMARGFSGLIMKDEDYWNWLKGGGGNVSFVGMDRQYLQADIRKLTGETGLAGRAWNVLTDPEASMWDKTSAVGKLPFHAVSKFVLDPLRAATQFAESASHLGAFKKQMRIQEAGGDDLRSQIIRSAWASRDTAVDAARMGANMRAYNMITAFANIKIQDTDRVVRAIKDSPLTTLTKIGGAITVPSVLLWAANHDDPRYNEIPQWQKDMFWLVMTPDHVFRIPKPWAMGMVFGSLPERMLDEFVAQKPDSFKEYFKSLWAASGPDFVPTAASPIIDQFANRSTFTNRTLIPSEQEKFLPEYQYTPYTTELTKSLGKIIGAFPGISELKMEQSGWGGTARALTSPILMENYIRGWSGTLGVYALDAADAALRKAGVIPDPPQPASTLADIPVIKAFVVRYPTATTESIQNFYDEYARNKTYFDTFMAKARDGDVAAMAHIQQMGGPMMFAQLDSIKAVLSEHSQLIRDLYKNPDTPPDEKRQLIDQLYYSMIQVGQHGNEAVRALRRQSDAIEAAARGIGPDLTADSPR
jgi:hypothetical protein